MILLGIHRFRAATLPCSDGLDPKTMNQNSPFFKLLLPGVSSHHGESNCTPSQPPFPGCFLCLHITLRYGV